MLDRAITAVTRSTGWRRRGLALAAGIACATAMAPLYWLPLMAMGYSILILLMDAAAQSPRRLQTTFMIGWLFGLGYFLVGLYWLAFSFLVQAEQFAWMAPFALFGFPAFLGLFSGAAASLAICFWRQGPARVLIFVAAWMSLEYLRGHILTGLPWNLPGQALAGSAVSAQGAAFVGIYGLSLLALLIACLPAAFISRDAPLGYLKGSALAVGSLAVLLAGGAMRLGVSDAGVHEDVRVRIVQPNIDQRAKIDGGAWWRNFETALVLSSAPGPKSGGVFVIWPENAAPLIDESPDALRMLSERLPKNAMLAAGAVRRDIDDRGADRFYNSIAFIAETPAGRRPIGFYDKHHLVPFGEYLPLHGILRALGLAQLAPYDEGFSKGEGPRTIRIGGPSFAPLVCYESIFPGRVHPKSDRPEWILTVTNDAWYGNTSGPRQHLDLARLRSIESGLPMARAANTGISALIDGAGRIVERTALYRTGVIDAPLPRELPPTPYSRLGDVPFLAMLIACALAGMARRPT